ncbi:TetR/AcrR family transcriptional regulator [Mycolicibacterium frederiksbergense]|uniref:TetR/AcrR family transcriptional regulator n=1 Tax=Mycolicibacterium frederiksbergense TaxID=117567 RepID=A0A6H0S299_9MYCO|nr:TetR/AcrR family transcriptional regulator [Mycolicibacterium frederiksbergense]QIV81488.1 TetR/AcrR family transcriptional regulator [Mycolicibacterium frederiksbergense]
MPRPLIPDRRARLVAAARELALDRGWATTTVADIAARAGIGKGAVYLEFPDKAAILAAVLNASMRTLTADVHRRVLDAGDVVDLPMIYRFGVEALLADPLMRAMYLGDETTLGEHVRAVTDDRYQQRFDWLVDYIVALQRIGVIDAGVAIKPLVRMLSVFTIGLLQAPGIVDVGADDQLRDTVGLFADLVGRGLATGLPVDPEEARQAQLIVLERLDAQLRQLAVL